MQMYVLPIYPRIPYLDTWTSYRHIPHILDLYMGWKQVLKTENACAQNMFIKSSQPLLTITVVRGYMQLYYGHGYSQGSTWGCILSLQAENTWIITEIVTQMLASKRGKIKHCLCQSCSYATVCAALLWSNVLPERNQFVSYREQCYIHGSSHLAFSSVFVSQQQPKTYFRLSHLEAQSEFAPHASIGSLFLDFIPLNGL